MQKKRGCSSRILKRTPKGYQDPILWAWLEIFSTPKGAPILPEHQKSVNFQIFLVIFILAHYP